MHSPLLALNYFEKSIVIPELCTKPSASAAATNNQKALLAIRLRLMSVWNTPCYNVEPLRNLLNNLQDSETESYSTDYDGICNFMFGDCGMYHPNLSGKVAKTLFAESKADWSYVRSKISTRKQGSIEDRQLFANTIKATRPKYAGLKGVYWAYSKFASGEAAYETNLAEDKLRTAFETTWSLAAIAGRVSAVAAKRAFEAYWPKKTPEWFVQEQTADSANKLWTTNRSDSYRRFTRKATVLIRQDFANRTREVAVDRELEVSEEYTETYDHLKKRTNLSDYDAMVRAAGLRERGVDTVPYEIARKLVTVPYVKICLGKRDYYQYRFNGGYILYENATGDAAILFKKDHDRFVQMLKSRAKLTKYYATYTVMQPDLNRTMVEKFVSLEKTFLDALDVDDHSKVNSYCRAYDVAQFLFLAKLSDDMWSKSVKAQEAKIKKEKLDELVDIDKVLEIVESEVDDFGVKESLELLKFYKIFPCPDFCVFSAMNGFVEKSANHNKATWSLELVNQFGEDFSTSKEEFWAYTKRSRLLAYFDTHGHLPGKLVGEYPVEIASYPNIPISSVKLEHMQYIDFRGAFRYRRYDMCEDELVKDKATAHFRNKEDPTESNQVMTYLFNKHFKRQKDINDIFAKGNVERKLCMDIDLRFKPEAKKPASRLFMMANDCARRQLSEFEANIATYAKKMRGSSQGKSEMDLTKSLSNMSKTWATDCEELLMSFDLAAFSPKQDPELKKFAYESWAYCFDEPDILNTIEIFTKSKVHVNTFGLDDTWDLLGNDLEGFNARLNTILHVEIMSYCVYKLRQVGWIDQSAELEVLIDDGLLKLKFPKSTYESTWKSATNMIEKIYASFGLEISWDKTFVSQVMCQYLNRVYYDGFEVTPGAKAYMRIGKLQEKPVMTISDELEMHAAATRGAIQSGSSHMSAYFAYIFECLLTVIRWSGYNMDDIAKPDLAFRLFLPVGLAGFGLNSLHGISTNSSFNSITAGLGNCRMIVHVFPQFQKALETVLSGGVRAMDDEQFLRSGKSLRTKYRTLNTRRFANIAKTYVMKRSVNPFVRKVIELLSSSEGKSVVDVISGVNVLHEVTRDRLWKMDVGPFLEKIVGKLQTSSTALKLIGAKKVAGILLINRSEARRLIKESAAGLFIKRA